MLVTTAFEIQTVSYIWVFRITSVHLYAETTIWMYKQSFQMRMSLPNREKHIQVKCQTELCRITELVRTAFREAAQSWNTEKRIQNLVHSFGGSHQKIFFCLADHDYWLRSSVSLRHELFNDCREIYEGVAFSAACSVCHRWVGESTWY